MSKPALGILAGAVLGLFDGLSAWMHPEARPMIAAIVIGSTIKGLVTGGVAGVIARRKQSLPIGISAGLIVGFVLSMLAARPQPGHFWEIVLPGMLLGAIVGFVTQRYPRGANVGSSSWPRGAASITALTLLAGWSGSAQPPASADPLSPVAFMVGRWEGTTEGRPGKGTVDRECRRFLGSRFIQVRNRSTYPPQERNRKGETHEDAGIYSFDAARKQIVLRQFHIEGFVNHYVLEPSSKPDSLVFISEAIENIPAGWRARETFVVLGPDQFDEVFELAEPGKGFEVYSRSRLRRVR